MNLIIVESPTKARTLSRFLGKDYSVEATMGHVKDLPKSKLSVDIEHNFEPDYQVVERQAKTIKDLLTEAKKAKANTMFPKNKKKPKANKKNAPKTRKLKIKRPKLIDLHTNDHNS